MEILPITREAFEAIVELACTKADVPYTEDSIVAAINYIHGLDSHSDKYDPDMLASYLRRAYCMQVTFDYTTEIRHKREAERAARNEAGPTLIPVAQSPEH